MNFFTFTFFYLLNFRDISRNRESSYIFQVYRTIAWKCFDEYSYHKKEDWMILCSLVSSSPPPLTYTPRSCSLRTLSVNSFTHALSLCALRNRDCEKFNGALSRILTEFWRAKIYISIEGNQKIMVHFYWQLLFYNTKTVKQASLAADGLACVAGGISRTSAFYPGFFSGRMLWSWPPSSEGLGEESSWDPACRNAWVFFNYAFASAREFRIG